jgi:3-oxoacyl-[acyl-carrier-protein] synthase II
MTERPRVFVRGVGAFTPLGASWPESFQALAQGKSAIQPVEHFDVRGFPCTVAAAVKAVPATAGTDRRMPMALAAASEAWAMARIGAGRRVGVFLGAEAGRPPFSSFVGMARAAARGSSFSRERLVLDEAALAFHGAAASPSAVASALAKEVGATSSVMTVSLACASSAAAIIEAVRAIRLGDCDAALCGGVGADVDPFMLAGFGLLGALSSRGVSCPFDVRRDGFVLGEGAAMLVLDTRPDGALAEIAGAGRTLDAFHLTAPEPQGEGAARAVRLALQDAHLTSVDYIQAHGTSTPLNDAVEVKALRRVLGASLDRSLVSSVKGALGHTVAASGALGLLCAIEAVSRGTILPTAGLREPDQDCALPHVMGSAISRKVNTALTNAFAFGGANCCLAVRRA